MTADPRTLSDEALFAALFAARERRLHDGCLGVRTELAVLEAEHERRMEIRDLERAWAAS